MAFSLMATKGTSKDEQLLGAAVDGILSRIINEWYEKVSNYYVTEEALAENPSLAKEAELKRFHDDGHLIKFNKDDLDFTYGLRSTCEAGHCVIEISVNNKVPNFDYENFRSQLFAHYARVGNNKLGAPSRLKDKSFKEVFQLEQGIDHAFSVEKRENRADIMRLSFKIPVDLLKVLANDKDSSKRAIESYCVSPFRSVYARVYRSGSA